MSTDQDMLTARRWRLRELEGQADKFGELCPPHLQQEIEDLSREIARLEEARLSSRALFTHAYTPSALYVFSSRSDTSSQPFLGRENLVETIRNRLCAVSGQPIWLGLNGVPGAGKTRLILRLADDARVREQFNGGIIYTALGQKPEIGATIRLWTEKLGIDYESHRTIPEQFSCIVSAIERRQKPFLLIIDDIWSAEDGQVFLSDNRYVSVLFASHQRTRKRQSILQSLVGAENLITVDTLSDAPSLALLCHSASMSETDSQDELASLAALTGGLPGLLLMMGSYIHALQEEYHNHWFLRTLDDLKDAARRVGVSSSQIEQVRRSFEQRGMLTWISQSLRPKPRPLDARVIIELCVGAMSRDMQRTFVRMGTFLSEPVSFDLATASHVVGLNEYSVHLLVRRHLLHKTDDGRLCLPRMLVDWARFTSSDRSEIQIARQKLLEWHQNLSTPRLAKEFTAWHQHSHNWRQMLQTWDESLHDSTALRHCVESFVRLLVEYGYHNRIRPGLERARVTIPETDPICALTHWHLGQVAFLNEEYEQAQTYGNQSLQAAQTHHQRIYQAMAFHLLGRVVWATGDTGTARSHFEKSLEQSYQVDDYVYAMCMESLALLLDEMNENDRARSLYDQTLSIREHVLGREHPETIRSLENLAALLEKQGDYQVAYSLYERSLAIKEWVLGREHPATAASLNNMGMLMRKQKQYHIARMQFDRALKICERSMGPDHPDTATCLNNLASLLGDQKDYMTARKLGEQAMAILERALGPDHPRTVRSLNNLAGLLYAQKEYADAQPLYERALIINEKVWGEEHPNTMISLHNLASLLYAQKEYDAARPLYERILKLRERLLGEDHPDTASTIKSLSTLLIRQGEYDTVRPIVERALRINQRVFGEEHPNTMVSMNNLAALMVKQGDLASARPLYDRLLEVRDRVLGSEHPQTIAVRKKLMDVLDALGE